MRQVINFFRSARLFFFVFSDELRPSSDLLPTIHPNSVLPYHPEAVDYEDYAYEEYEEKVTKPYVPEAELSSTTVKPTMIKPAVASSKDRPVFVEDPQNAYIVRGQPAMLRCKVIHADKAYFTCNGEAMAASELHKEVDKVEIKETASMEVVHVKTLTLQLNRINIEEFFGLYACQCDAWSARGMTASKNATVEVACKSANFQFVSRPLS